MKAFQMTAHGTPGEFRLTDVPDPQPGSQEVVVEVQACGLNRLDLWLESGALPIPIKLPRTPGCEVAGQIALLGGQVTGWRVGDRVAVQSNLFCGACEFCQRGEESMCLHGQLLGVQCDGGFAEQVLAPASSLVRLPPTLSVESAAALSLAASTAMHMLTHRTQVRAGDWVLVMAGASGVGSAAIQIAHELGARVIATGSTEAKRDLARKLGAELAVDSGNVHWPAEVRQATGKRGVDLVVEHIGGRVLEQAWQCLARGGTVVTCGASAGRDVCFNLWPFFVKQHQLIGSYGRNRADLAATLDWANRGRLKPVIDQVFTLAQADLAFSACATDKRWAKCWWFPEVLVGRGSGRALSEVREWLRS